jgi:predicted RNA-binding protein with PIN domain
VRRLLVDGNNVIGARPDGWWRDRTAAMARLVSALDRLEEDVTVVFDGRDRDLGARRVTVAFAGSGRDAADGEIARRAAADPDPGTLAVVTSDRALAAQVSRAGASVVGAGAFRTRLDAMAVG